MPRIARRMLYLLVYAAVGLYIALAILAFFSDRVIFQPQPSSYGDSDLIRAGVVPLKIRSEEKTITAVYLPNPQARFTLLFSHGNAEDVGDDLPLLREFHDAGFAVLAYDYRGYGTSEGVSSEKSVYADVLATYEHATTQLRIPAENIISFGRSLGSAAAIELADRKPVAGLIVEAPFVSAFRVLTRVQLLPWDKFRNRDKIRRIHAPVLVIHGRNDRVIPFRHGQQIFAAANEPKQSFWVDGAGHNDVFFVAHERYIAALRDFTLNAASVDANRR